MFDSFKRRSAGPAVGGTHPPASPPGYDSPPTPPPPPPAAPPTVRPPPPAPPPPPPPPMAPGMHPPALPTLDELVRGFHSAASQASALLQQQSALLLKEYFSVASDGRTLVAKVVKIALDQHHYTLVPLVSLVSPSAFSLETMKVKLAVRFDQVETRMQDGMVDESGKGANFRVSVSPITNAPEGSSTGPRYVELEFTFKQHDPPEGIQRILEQFTNAIVPKAETEGALYDANPVLEFPSAMPPPSDADLQD